MLYHCGLLSERPEKDATLQWVRRGGWDLPGHPPEIERERKIWLSMPGFSVSFHAHTLGQSPTVVKRHVGRDYAEFKDEVAANWLSCTREDAVRLSRIRPSTGNIPVISQLAILDDLKRGIGPTEIGEAYRVHPVTVAVLRRVGIRPHQSFLPEGFKLIHP